VILGFLAIECVGQIASVLLEQRARGNCRQRNAFVSGAEQQVELDPGLLDGVGVKLGQRGQVRTAVENPRVEKIGDFRVNSPNLSAPRCRQ
jgi:hypothetical protein